MQRYKVSDTNEEKMIASGDPILSDLSVNKSLFLQGAYNTAPLGDLIYDTKRAPLTNAIAKEIFRDSFKEIFDAFIAGGTFEAYLTVFRKIFGDDVDVEFTVPAAGKLNIDIEATGVVLYDFLAKVIVDNEYTYDEVIDDEGDNIAFQQVKGFQTQYEVEQMLNEMVPAGIFTTISLTIA